MSEIFKEYLIKQKKSTTDVLAQVGIVVAALIISILAFTLGGQLIGPIVVIAAIFGAGYLFSHFSREYEYILTNNELDIDVVYNRSRRKRVTTIDIKKIDIMASTHDSRYTAELNKQAKLVNASDNQNGPNTYAIIGPTQLGYCKVLITPNEQFLNDLYRQAPNKVFKKL